MEIHEYLPRRNISAFQANDEEGEKDEKKMELDEERGYS